MPISNYLLIPPRSLEEALADLSNDHHKVTGANLPGRPHHDAPQSEDHITETAA